VENRLVLGGVTRISPAGIPISRFLLKHRSEQSEAGMKRQTQCVIGVVATGHELQDVIKQLHQGSGVNVSGFLTSANSRSGEYRLVLHVTEIEPVASSSMV